MAMMITVTATVRDLITINTGKSLNITIEDIRRKLDSAIEEWNKYNPEDTVLERMDVLPGNFESPELIRLTEIPRIAKLVEKGDFLLTIYKGSVIAYQIIFDDSRLTMILFEFIESFSDNFKISVQIDEYDDDSAYDDFPDDIDIDDEEVE